MLLPLIYAKAFAGENSLYQDALQGYDSLLKSAVSASRVDYDALKKEQHLIERYLYALSAVKLDDLQKDETTGSAY